MNNNRINKRFLLILAGLALIFVLVIGWLLGKDSGTGTDTTTLTPTTTRQQAPTEEEGKTTSRVITYKGDDQLVNRGMTPAILTGTKNALLKFFDDKNKTAVTSITVSNVEHTHDSTGATSTDNMFFTALTNTGETYLARVEYYDLYNMRLYVYNQSNQQLFDSGLYTRGQPVSSTGSNNSAANAE